MSDIITMGEALIDFVPKRKDVSLDDNEAFFRRLGGAPANVAVGVARLGVDSLFMGKVGQDAFGEYIINTLNDYGVNTECVKQTDRANTCISFIVLDENGERDFVFYRNSSADLYYCEEDVNIEVFNEAKIFHFGSLSLTAEPIREATYKCIAFARDNGLLLSYDPNYRASLWPDRKTAQKWIKDGLGRAEIVKLSVEELELITGTADPEKGISVLCDEFYNLKLIFVTLGSDGCYYKGSSSEEYIQGFNVDVEDTTGSGDAFTATVLSSLVWDDLFQLDNIGEDTLKNIVVRANAAGALTACGKGAIFSLPSWKEIRKLAAWRR